MHASARPRLPHAVEERIAGDHLRRAPRPGLDGALVLLVRGDPVRVDLPLAQRFRQVVVEALARDRKHPDERLQHEQLLARILETAELGAPGVKALAPLRYEPADRSDSGTHVGRTLGVVRVRRQQLAREALEALHVRLVEAVEVEPETRRSAPDLVQRRQTEVAVEGRVLHAFRHHRPGLLLEADDELLEPGRLEQQDPPELLRDICTSDLLAIRVLDDALVGLDVRPVDVERAERAGEPVDGRLGEQATQLRLEDVDRHLELRERGDVLEPACVTGISTRIAP